MPSMHEQIAAHLSPVESLLAVGVMRRPSHAKTAGLVAGGLLGGLLTEAVQKANGRARGTMADRIGHPDKTYGVVTTHRVVFFADHKFKINTLGAPIVGFGREHLVAVTPTLRKVTDSDIRLHFADGSDAKLVWRKRKEIAPWIAAIDHVMSSSAANTAPPGYVSYVLPPGI